MTYDVLASGSSGNATVINGEILIDCGVPMKLLRQSGHVKSLKLVLTTHCHSDHFCKSTVRALHRERPALRWAACEWMVSHLLEAGVDSRVIDVLEPADEVPEFQGGWYDYDYFIHVKVDKTIHDVPNCCYHISDWFSGYSMFYATDCATLNGISAPGYDLYMVEANFAESEIKSRIADKMARGEFCYELRAERTHLSMEQALEWLAQNARPDSEIVFLHQHKEIEK